MVSIVKLSHHMIKYLSYILNIASNEEKEEESKLQSALLKFGVAWILYPEVWEFWFSSWSLVSLAKPHPQLVLIVKWHVGTLTWLFFCQINYTKWCRFTYEKDKCWQLRNGAILPKKKHKTQLNQRHSFTSQFFSKLNHNKQTQNPDFLEPNPTNPKPSKQ